MKNLSIKQQLYNHCQALLNKRLETIRNTIFEIQKALESETKSSAGDKHETGRAMLQLEREKAGQQLAEVQKLQEILQKVDYKSKHKRVGLGSIVFTSKQHYFISISAGEFEIDNTNYFAISVVTPIAKELLGKTKGDTFSFRNSIFTVIKVL
ncbi:3-oxoacyl-ACP synthase [Ichthyenterobacterium sp. W332]|uniref:3-oxoacyl-ACP synthase n=1 Tax=Microcosmobacter mediterraneus TaxID=3075607 RepID=A0ABU2YIY1_9FLAO|nr:3-oxoacyl-ACP synthase [Ichthyenterobacterium sp. W332]MDT0558127.1 3-oxoacyl-ACP synthase [Ichthyenterobacterium sp. W332]